MGRRGDRPEAALDCEADRQELDGNVNPASDITPSLAACRWSKGYEVVDPDPLEREAEIHIAQINTQYRLSLTDVFIFGSILISNDIRASLH